MQAFIGWDFHFVTDDIKVMNMMMMMMMALTGRQEKTSTRDPNHGGSPVFFTFRKF
jgi:hypothetical protein